jgi:transcriptional regulator with PAS, ATPase and Fis domain
MGVDSIPEDAHSWVNEFPAAITVAGTDGQILEMNQAAAAAFQSSGGRALIGQNLLDCHPEPSRTKLRQLMENRQTHVYTIEKQGVRKLIYQAPWYRDGQYAGFLEIALPIPASLPHFNRDEKT